jgi:hypothetical protein
VTKESTILLDVTPYSLVHTTQRDVSETDNFLLAALRNCTTGLSRGRYCSQRTHIQGARFSHKQLTQITFLIFACAVQGTSLPDYTTPNPHESKHNLLCRI